MAILLTTNLKYAHLELDSVGVVGLEPFSLFVVSGIVSLASLLGLGAIYLTERVHTAAPPTLALVTIVTSIFVTIFVSLVGIHASRTTPR